MLKPSRPRRSGRDPCSRRHADLADFARNAESTTLVDDSTTIDFQLLSTLDHRASLLNWTSKGASPKTRTSHGAQFLNNLDQRHERLVD